MDRALDVALLPLVLFANVEQSDGVVLDPISELVDVDGRRRSCFETGLLPRVHAARVPTAERAIVTLTEPGTCCASNSRGGRPSRSVAPESRSSWTRCGAT